MGLRTSVTSPAIAGPSRRLGISKQHQIQVVSISTAHINTEARYHPQGIYRLFYSCRYQPHSHLVRVVVGGKEEPQLLMLQFTSTAGGSPRSSHTPTNGEADVVATTIRIIVPNRDSVNFHLPTPTPTDVHRRDNCSLTM